VNSDGRESKYRKTGFYPTRYAIEIPLTRNVLLALADSDLSYRPHERNPSAGDIISTIAKGLEIRNGLAELRYADVAPRPPASYQLLIRDFDQLSEALVTGLLQLNQQQWAESSQLRLGERIVLEQPLGEIMWLFQFDMIHYRGQLSTYLRPIGAKVPSIYGNSGDDKQG
jgi:uncharacterized damage-inducible protein DinB